MPAAKERGDRGGWNYPSQATAAFEMVLSPGAGITSAAGVQLSPLPSTGTTAAGIASAAGVQLSPPSPREKLYKPFDKPPEAWYNKGAKKRKEETPQ